MSQNEKSVLFAISTIRRGEGSSRSLRLLQGSARSRAPRPFDHHRHEENRVMNRKFKQRIGTALVGLAMIAGAPLASAKEVVKIAFLAPLTGSVSADGIGGRKSAELSGHGHNHEPHATYEI